MIITVITIFWVYAFFEKFHENVEQSILINPYTQKVKKTEYFNCKICGKKCSTVGSTLLKQHLVWCKNNTVRFWAHSSHIVIQEDYPNFLNEIINY